MTQPRRELQRTVALWQGLFYMVTGVWPLFHMKSFLKVTGPKTDLWLVNTVGALLAVAGGALALAARRGAIRPEMRALGVGTAATLVAVDCIYVARKRISPVYLLDAAAELGIISAWALASVPDIVGDDT
jgi:hypothetical protein